MNTETLKTNWQSMPKHARVGDYKDIISPKFANQYGEYAFNVLLGEPYKYSTVLEFMLDYLERHKEKWMKREDIRSEASIAGYHTIVIGSGLNRLEKIANVGRKYEVGNVYFRWYDRKEGDDLNQEAIDNF